MNRTFSDCPVDELKQMVSDAKQGKIDLNDYWNVGNMREVKIQKEVPNITNKSVIFRIMNISDKGVGQTVTFDYAVPLEVIGSVEGNQRSVFELVKELSEQEFGIRPSRMKVFEWQGSTSENTTWSDKAYFDELPPRIGAIFGAL